MIKKKTALFFVLFANFILLAHAVIPHHHHEDEFCVFNVYCNSSDFSQSILDLDHHNDHNHSSDAECCDLIQEVIIPSNYLNQFCKCLCFNCDNSLNLNCIATLIDNKIEYFVQEYVKNPIPPLIFTFTQIVNNLFGLRAPPIV